MQWLIARQSQRVVVAAKKLPEVRSGSHDASTRALQPCRDEEVVGKLRRVGACENLDSTKTVRAMLAVGAQEALPAVVGYLVCNGAHLDARDDLANLDFSIDRLDIDGDAAHEREGLPQVEAIVAALAKLDEERGNVDEVLARCTSSCCASTSRARGD